MDERPTTTACLPSSSIPYSSSNNNIPLGVQGYTVGTSPENNFPKLYGVKPSTSLSGKIEFITLFFEIYSGKGN